MASKEEIAEHTWTFEITAGNIKPLIKFFKQVGFHTWMESNEVSGMFIRGERYFNFQTKEINPKWIKYIGAIQFDIDVTRDQIKRILQCLTRRTSPARSVKLACHGSRRLWISNEGEDPIAFKYGIFTFKKTKHPADNMWDCQLGKFIKIDLPSFEVVHCQDQVPFWKEPIFKRQEVVSEDPIPITLKIKQLLFSINGNHYCMPRKIRDQIERLNYQEAVKMRDDLENILDLMEKGQMDHKKFMKNPFDPFKDIKLNN